MVQALCIVCLANLLSLRGHPADMKQPCRGPSDELCVSSRLDASAGSVVCQCAVGGSRSRKDGLSRCLQPRTIKQSTWSRNSPVLFPRTSCKERPTRHGAYSLLYCYRIEAQRRRGEWRRWGPFVVQQCPTPGPCSMLGRSSWRGLDHPEHGSHGLRGWQGD